MARFAFVDNVGGGLVLNIAESSDSRLPPWILCDDSVRIGWTFTPPTTFTAPVPTAADYGASLKYVVNGIQNKQLEGGVTYGGISYSTTALQTAIEALGRHDAIAGSRK